MKETQRGKVFEKSGDKIKKKDEAESQDKGGTER